MLHLFWAEYPFKCVRKLTPAQQQARPNVLLNLISSFAANQQGS